MKDLDKIKVKLENGEEKEAEVLRIVENENNGKNYVVYTFDTDKEEVDIYASEIIENDENIVLDSVKTEEEWKYIQQKISELVNE